jgi:hypothetical protein
MRGSPGIIRLYVVKSDERIFPTTPSSDSARNLQQIPGAPAPNIWDLSLTIIILSDGDHHVRSPEVRLEGGARVYCLSRMGVGVGVGVVTTATATT